MGFEPMTFWATTRRSKPTELRPHGAADGVRTRDLLNGNQMLYQLSHSRIWYLRSQSGFSGLYVASDLSHLFVF